MNIPIPIIVLNWNGHKDTTECIESLSQQTFTDFTVYLVDNNSIDKSQGALQSLSAKYPWIDLRLNSKNLGFTRGNNVLIREILNKTSIPDYIILLNNDTIQNPDWLKNLIQSAIDNEAHVISSKMIDYFNRAFMDNAGHFMLNTGEIISIGHQESIDKFNTPFENIGACGGAALYSTKMLQDIGVFDEYFDTGYEDAELGLRAFIAGYKCWYEPTAIVYHKMGQSIKKVFDEKYVLKIQKSIWYTYFKLLPKSLILIAIPSLLFKYISLSSIHLVFGEMKSLKVLNQTITHLWRDRIKVQKMRASFIKNHSIRPPWQIRRKQVFFLLFDIRRFLKIYLFRRRKVFEKYT